MDFQRADKVNIWWKKILRFFFKSFLWSAFALILFVSVSSALIYFFQDNIKKYAIESINEQLQTGISVADIELTVFKQFPYASLEFKEVVCNEVYNRPDSNALFSAQSLFLQFNLWNVITQNYTVKKITLENAKIQLYRDENGVDNWHFWKPSKDTTTKNKSFAFKLNAVKLKNVEVQYLDDFAKVDIQTHIDDLLMSGRFSDKQFALNARTSLLADMVRVNGVTYSDNYKLKLDARFDADTEQNIYKIKYCGLQIEDLPLEAKGGFLKDEKGWFIDIDLNGKSLNISSILSMLPENIREVKENYKSTGKIELDAKTKGYFLKSELPVITANFSVSDATFKYVPSSIEMKKVQGKGSLKLGKKADSFIQVDYVEAHQKNSRIKGSFMWKNFAKPEVKTVADLSADLAEFLPFFSLDTLENVQGRADMKLELILKASGPKFTTEDFRLALIDGSMELANVSIGLKNSNLQLNDVSGNFLFDNNNVWLRKASGIFNENRIELDGKALNLLSYILTTTEPLYLAVNLKSDELNIDQWLQQNTTAKEQSTNKNNATVFALPKRLAVDFNANVKKIKFNKFEASNIEGNVSLKDRVFVAKSLVMSTMDGEALVSGVADNSNGNWLVTANGRFTKINATKLFYTFNNFEQDQLTHENISGSVDAVFDFKAKFDSQLKVDLKSLYSLISLTVNKGELKNFTPLEKLSGWAKLEELQHVKFSTLKNEILIRDEKVIMPEMSIISNAMNLNLGGEHRFDNVVDYRFNLDLGTLLANKFKLKRSAKQEEFGEIIEENTGRMRIFIHMYGPMDDLKFGLDGKSVKAKIEADFQKERVNVRDIIQQEFGRVKNDSILKKDPWLQEKQIKRDSTRKASKGGVEEFEFE